MGRENGCAPSAKETQISLSTAFDATTLPLTIPAVLPLSFRALEINLSFEHRVGAIVQEALSFSGHYTVDE